MSAIRNFWYAIQGIFDPELPVMDRSLFAERDPQYNPLVNIERRLKRIAPQYEKVLVVGTVGNGKTSELYHLADSLGRHRKIITFDLWRHFQAAVGDPAALNRVDPWEILGILGLAIFRAAEHLGHTWGHEPKLFEKALEDLRESDQGGGPAINISQLAKGIGVGVSAGVGGVTGGLAGAALASRVAASAVSSADAVSWSWKLGAKKHREDQEVLSLLNAVNGMIMGLQTAFSDRVLLLVDGLDRADATRMPFLFVDSTLFSELVCDAVWIARPEVQLLDNGIRGFKVQELCNIPVLDRDAPQEYGKKGLEFFRSLVAKRLARVQSQVPGSPSDPFPQDLIDHLAYYSGGVSRDFVRMIREAAGEAWEAEVPALTPDIVKFTLREARRLKEAALNADEIKLLEDVMRDPQRRRPAGEVAAKLVGWQRLLPYPNETTWYYPHPLLTLALLKPGRGSAG